MAGELGDKIFDILVDNENCFLTVYSIQNKLDGYYPQGSILSACMELESSYDNVNCLFAVDSGSNSVRVFIFSSDNISTLRARLCGYTPVENPSYDYYLDTLDYLDYVSNNKETYNFNPNSKLGRYYPLEFLGCVRPEHRDRSKQIKRNLLLNYDVEFPSYKSTVEFEAEINNLKNLNTNYKNQIDELNRTIDLLQERISILEKQSSEKKKDWVYEILVGLFVALSCAVYYQLMNYSGVVLFA